MADKVKWIWIEDGTGFQKRIPRDKWPEAKRTYAELQAAARKLGRSEEEAAQFNLRIVKEELLDG